MATYAQIQEYINNQFGYKPKFFWIAHVKELCGLKPKVSSRRYDNNCRVCPCPPIKQADINAFEHFNMV